MTFWDFADKHAGSLFVLAALVATFGFFGYLVRLGYKSGGG